MDARIPFNRPCAVGTETDRIREAIESGHLSADGRFTDRCQRWLEARTGAHAALLTHSCTGALEAAAMLSGVGSGDEVIVPSYTFVSTAAAFALRGATPVFVDVHADTLNLDEELVADAVGPKTRAIVPVHYAGVACEMEALGRIAADHDLLLIEDAAQGAMAFQGDRALGGIGHLGTLSFHETKNLTCGEGGALLINSERFLGAAEIIRDKGTNRKRFFRGEIDKYTWVGLGSSLGMSDLNAAFLWAQLERADEITRRRQAVWDRYHAAFAELEVRGVVRRPMVPDGCRHNGHLYYLLLEDRAARDAALKELEARGINAVFHYVPLHSSPAGRRLGRAHGDMSVTDDVSGRLLRLPLWAGIADADVERVAAVTCDVVERRQGRIRTRKRPTTLGS